MVFVFPLLSGIGVFVSGIVEIVQSTKTTTHKGIGLSTGIINVVSGFMFFIPFVGWIIPLIGTIFSYVSYFKNTN